MNRPECRLRSLPAAAPWLNKLVRLSLSGTALKAGFSERTAEVNAFSAVPPVLLTTALEVLDMSKQKLRDSYVEQHTAAVQGLRMLDDLTRLHCVNLKGFKQDGAGICGFRAAHPNVRVISRYVAGRWNPVGAAGLAGAGSGAQAQLQRSWLSHVVWL